MKKILLVTLISLLTIPQIANADATGNSVTMQVSPEGKIEAGKSIKVKIKLSEIDSGKAVNEDDLKIAHTKKLHLLVIEPTFVDYQHIHPTPTGTPGEFTFDFTPKNKGTYRIFADITPIKTDKQEYVIADIGGASAEKAEIDRSIYNQANVDGYKFNLVFDNVLQAGMASMGTLKVEDSTGKPVDYLEPVMGAFAHIVAFSEDYKTVVHIHPMGKEPEKVSDRGGPNLEFHIQPATVGFVKLFAQFRIKGKDIFVPFGLNIGNPIASN